MTTALGLTSDYGWRREQDLARVARDLDRAHSEALAEKSRRALTYEQFSGLGILAPPAASGVPVTQFSALTVPAYWCGIVVISGSLGILDRGVYKKAGPKDDPDSERERARDHPAYALVHDAPNPYTSAMTFWETLFAHAISWGNGYAEIERNNAGQPIALWNITPDLIEPRVEAVMDAKGRRQVRLVYLYRGTQSIAPEDILHVPGPGYDGLRGYSPVALFRQSLGLSIAAERFGSTFFGNGAWPGLALEHPKTLSPGAHERLKGSIQTEHQGPDRAHRLIILEEGMKVSKPITIPPDDAQFLQTREMQIEEVARILNIPPQKLKHKGGERPGGNYEAEQISYLTDTLLPWATRAEQECNRKLIIPAQRGTFYIEHEFKKILRTDHKTRTEIQRAYWEMKVLTNQQIAAQENLPKPALAEPPAAQDPMALPSLDKAPKDLPAAAPADAPPPKARTAARTLLTSIVLRYLRREGEQARRASRKGASGFGAWVEDFYGPDERGVLADSLDPALAMCVVAAGVERDGRDMARNYAAVHHERSKSDLLTLPHRDLVEAVAALTKRWESVRAVEEVEGLMTALGAEEEAHVA